MSFIEMAQKEFALNPTDTYAHTKAEYYAHRFGEVVERNRKRLGLSVATVARAVGINERQYYLLIETETTRRTPEQDEAFRKYFTSLGVELDDEINVTHSGGADARRWQMLKLMREHYKKEMKP